MKAFYKILSFLLIPPALLYSMLVLILTGAALANPALLLLLFILVCAAIYTFTSFYFLIKGIDGGSQLSPSLKDWIKVNAVVTIVFVLVITGQSIFIFTHPEILEQGVAEAIKQQEGTMTFTKPELIKYMNIILFFFLVYSTLLLIHIFLTLKFIKANADLFAEKKS